MTCRTCKWLEPHRREGKSLQIRKGFVYRCLFPTEVPKFPDSVTGAYDFQWPPNKRHMGPEDGTNCPTYEKKV